MTTSCYGRRLTKSRLPISGEEFWIRTKVFPKGRLRSLFRKILFACKPNAIVVSRRKKEVSNPIRLLDVHIVFETSLDPVQVFFRWSPVRESNPLRVVLQTTALPFELTGDERKAEDSNLTRFEPRIPHSKRLSLLATLPSILV